MVECFRQISRLLSSYPVADKLLSSCDQCVINLLRNCYKAVKIYSCLWIPWKIHTPRIPRNPLHTLLQPPGLSRRPLWLTSFWPWQPDASKSRINVWTYLRHRVLLENLRKACRRWSRYWQSSWRRRKQSQRQLEPWKITLPIFNFACILSKVQEFKNQIGLI